MKVFIKDICGKTYEVNACGNDTVQTLKEKFQDLTGVPLHHQHLIYNRKELKNAHTLDVYKIQRESTVHLVLRYVGGGGFSLTSLKTEPMAYSIEAPEFRHVCNGLNIELSCTCEGYNPYLKLGIGKFRMEESENGGMKIKKQRTGADVKEEEWTMEHLTCPSCKEVSHAISFGFSHCKYHCKGLTERKHPKEHDGIADSTFISTDSEEKENWEWLEVTTSELIRKITAIYNPSMSL